MVLRVWAEDPDTPGVAGPAAEVAAMDAAREAGVPVPEVFWHGSDPVLGDVAVMELVVGERFDRSRPVMRASDWSAVLGDVGGILTAIRSLPRGTPYDLDWAVWMHERLDTEPVRAALGDVSTLHRWVDDRAGAVAALRDGSAAHGDLREDNLLLARVDGRFRVVALLDWEFASTDTTFWDLGTFLRREQEYPPGAAGALVREVRERGWGITDDELVHVRELDLANVVEKLVGFPQGSPPWRFAVERVFRVVGGSAANS